MPVYFETRKNKRQTNQDSYLFLEYRINHEAMIRTFLVADGMGGLSYGEVASKMAVEQWILKLQKFTMSEGFLGKNVGAQIDALKSFSYRVMQEINEEVYGKLTDKGVSGGTTLTAGILFYHTLILVNCGDSPAYYFHGGKKSLVKISKDQNLAEELFRQGKTEKNSSLYYQKKNRLTDYIGKYKEPYPHVSCSPFEPGDAVLIGSDGAFGPLVEEEIRAVFLSKEKKPEQIIPEMFDLAERQGEEDNQTLILYIEENQAPIQAEPPKRFRIFGKRQVV